MTKEGKYTIIRSKEDIQELHDVDGILEFYTNKMYTSDSKRYRDLPKVTAIMAGKIQDLQRTNSELTAKLEQLEDIRSCVCRIMNICKGGKK